MGLWRSARTRTTWRGDQRTGRRSKRQWGVSKNAYVFRARNSCKSSASGTDSRVALSHNDLGSLHRRRGSGDGGMVCRSVP